MKIEFDPAKRIANLAKHGLDLADAGLVLDSSYRYDVAALRGGEACTLSFAYVFKHLRALMVVHTERTDVTRVISFRPANQLESEAYYDWIGKESD
jgi:uncharacterized protein